MRRAAAWLLAMATLLPGLAAAQTPPKLELGGGAALLSLPDYRGADERHGYLLPFPYVVYRGDRLRVDRGGVAASLVDAGRLELDLSFTGNFALRSAGNQARLGMPRLHPLIEAGPELVFRLMGGDSRDDTRLDVRLATRTAVAVGGGRISGEGWVASPYLSLHLPSLAGSGTDVTATLGLLYGSRRYHRYLYSVAPEYARPDRPAYEAPGGYAGITSQLSAGRRIGPWWLGGYIKFDSLKGSQALENSPLVKSRHYAAAGIALAWVFDLPDGLGGRAR